MKLKDIFHSLSKKKDPSVNIFTESTLRTSFYEELQKNGWCEIVNDKPDNLFEVITSNVKKTKKI